MNPWDRPTANVRGMAETVPDCKQQRATAGFAAPLPW